MVLLIFGTNLLTDQTMADSEAVCLSNRFMTILTDKEALSDEE